MPFRIPTELLGLIAVSALVTSLAEEAFKRNALSRLVAHIVAAALLLIVFSRRYWMQPLSVSRLIAPLTTKLSLYFIGISAGIASILEAFIRPRALYRFVAHFVALLVAVLLLD